MINIQDIIPFMKKGWVAMDKDKHWWWFSKKPVINKEDCDWYINCEMGDVSVPFKIAPADDWTKSLIKVGGK